MIRALARSNLGGRVRGSMLRDEARRPKGHGLLNGLVEWWDLAEQSGNRLGVFSGITLEDNNTVTGEMGIGSLASYFQGSNNEFLVSLDSRMAIGTATDFALCFWVFLDSTSGGKVIVAKNNYPADKREFEVNFNGTKFSFLKSANGLGGTETSLESNEAPSASTWYMVTAQWSGGTASLQVNDNAAATQAHATGIFASDSPFAIGCRRYGSTVDTPMTGRVQRVGLWKGRTLSSDEVLFLYNGGRGRDFPFS